MGTPPNGTPKPNPRFFLALCTAALVFAAVEAVYLANGRTIGAGDTRPARYLPFAILRDGTFYLDGLVDSGAQGPPRYYVNEIDGHYVSDYPVGAAITGAVFYAPSVLQGRRPQARLCAKLEKYAASAIVALSAAVLFAALRLLTGPVAALFLTAIYAFATSNLSTASQALWQHGASELMIASALYAILRARDDDRWAPLAGFPLAFALVCRPTNALLALPLAAYALFCHPRRGGWLIVAALPPLAFQLWYNLEYFGDPLHAQFPINGGAIWSTPLGEGLAGLLSSPARGLLVYSPVFAFSLFGLAAAWRRTGDGLLRSLGIGVVLTLLLYARWFRWWGGWTYGPRILADLIPALTLGLLPVLPTLRRTRSGAALFALALIWSLAAHALGAFYGDYEWNGRPVSIDRSPERLWSWTDNQLVHSAAAFARIVRTSPTGRLLRRWAGADRDQRKRSVNQPPAPFRWDFGGEIALVGYEWQPTGPRSFSITYAWLGERLATNDYAISVHLDGPGVRFQDDYVLGAGSQWQSGKPIEITREVTVPEGAPPGWYIIRVGAWQPSTGRKLRLAGGWFPKTSIDLVDLKVTSGDVRYLSRSQLPFLRHE